MRRGHDGGDVPDRRRPEIEGRACSKASRCRVPAGSARPRRAEDSSVLAGSRRPDSSASHQATRRQDRFANGLSAQQRDCPAVQPASRRTDRPPRRSASGRLRSVCAQPIPSAMTSSLNIALPATRPDAKSAGFPGLLSSFWRWRQLRRLSGCRGFWRPPAALLRPLKTPVPCPQGRDSVERKTADDVVMTLGGSADTYVLEGEDYLEAGCHALDPEEGDITSTVVVEKGLPDTSTPGDYSVVYTATTADGSVAQATRTVHVVESFEENATSPFPCSCTTTFTRSRTNPPSSTATICSIPSSRSSCVISPKTITTAVSRGEGVCRGNPYLARP